MNAIRLVRSGFLGGTALLLAGAVAAPAQEAPKPGPEHQKLGYYVGKWKAEGELKANPMMPAGKYTATDECEWFEGGFAVVCNSEGSGPTGKMKGVALLGYSTEDKVYTYYGVDSSGMVPSTVARGTVEGDTWTYTDEAKMGGQLIKSRYTITQASATEYTFKWEMQGPDGNWLAIWEGKSTKSD